MAPAIDVTIRFLDLGADVIYEVLAHLNVEDLIQIRQVCGQLMLAAQERRVWDSVYRRASLLLPAGPFYHQQYQDLEGLLLRATRLQRSWGSSIFGTRQITKAFTFPRELPAYSFDAQVISGRYLQLAEQDGLSWYDLDGDCTTPILSYKCQYIATITGFLRFQTNAQGAGPTSVWVTCVCSYPMRIMVLRLDLREPNPTVELEAVLSAECVVEVELGYDYILPIKEFAFPNAPFDLFHIPSKRMFQVPMHAQVRTLSDLSHMNYLFTPSSLFLFFSLKSETHLEVYRLPDIEDLPDDTDCLPPLQLSHRGIYPHMISKINIFNSNRRSSEQSHPSYLDQGDGDPVITLLAVVYMRQSLTSWTSKVNLHLLDIRLCRSGTVEFTIKCSQTLKVGIAATSLASTSRNGFGFAMTHSSPGPTLRVYHIRHDEDGRGSSMAVAPLRLPVGLQSRELLAFDGYRGRLCLVHGWTRIEVLDYA